METDGGRQEMLFKFCAECGHELQDIKCGDDDCKICPSCKRIYGRNPIPTYRRQHSTVI